MLNKISTKDEAASAIAYLGDDYLKVPYLYVNLIKYGTGTENIVTFADKLDNGKISALFMLYYDCIHFYSKDKYPVDLILNFIHSHDN